MVLIVDVCGCEVCCVMIEYNVVGLCELFELLSWVGVCEVVIECLDGLVVDILFEVGIMVVVISFN